MSDNNKKVLVAMSGGIDSTAAALLLQAQGYTPIGITMKTWDYATSGGVRKTTGCCSLDDINDARAICVAKNIPHWIIDIRNEFTESVIENFVDEYMAGRTPNPCVLCNTHIKWGALAKRAKALGCDFIATGHYANVMHGNGRYWIKAGLDETKDQSYVLWGLSQEVLARTLFPVGKYEKKEIRKMVEDMGYADMSQKSESYEICFIPDNDYRSFISRKRTVTPGNFVDPQGNVIGTHEGTPYFTIGQRRGMGISAREPLYVTEIRASRNEVVLGTQEHLSRSSMNVEKVNLLKYASIPDGLEALVKIRYKDKGAMATLHPQPDGSIRVDFVHAVSAITPGQSAVFYDGDDLDEVIGGGHIQK